MSGVAVFRALRLGDMLCAVPALRALRAWQPEARITLVGLPWARDFARRFARYVDDFLPFPGYPGLPEQPPALETLPRFFDNARARRFELALQLHGDGRISNGIVEHFGASALAGFRPAGSASPPDFLPYPQRGPEIARLLELVRVLGAPDCGVVLEFPLTAGDRKELAAFTAQRRLPEGPCICLHPGARALERRWPPENFARVGDALHARYGLPVLITGSEDERALAAAVQRAMRAPAFDAAGPIAVGALGALIARARVVVSNDTGVSHLAAALGVPSVVVFKASDMERWAPLDRELHRAVWDPPSRRVDEVLEHARALLDAPPRASARARGASPLPG